MATTTAKGVPYPVPSDANNVPVDVQALATWVDAHPGVTALTAAARDALTGAELWAGRVIWNTTAIRLERYDATASLWRAAAVTDHGSLTGLTNDDHRAVYLRYTIGPFAPAAPRLGDFWLVTG